MEKIIFTKTLERTYRNNGQHKEQLARYNLTGTIEKADNIPAEKAGDCGDIQIKSARATVCKGLDLDKYLEKDFANSYFYVSNDCKTAYLFSKKEWATFCKLFATIQKDSSKNGGNKKMRLKSESKEMLWWLEKATRA